MDSIDQEILYQLTEIKKEINDLERRYDESFDEIERVVREEIEKINES